MKRTALVVIFTLLLALFISGLANFFFIRELRNRYSDTLASELRASIIMRTIARESIFRQRELGLMVDHKKDPALYAAYRASLRGSLRQIDRNFQKLDQIITQPKARILLMETLAARDHYYHEMEKVLTLVDQDRMKEADYENDQILHPYFTNYLKAQDALAQKLETFDDRQNVKLLSWSAFIQWLPVAFSTWPVILLFVLSAGFLVWAFFMGWNRPDEKV